MFLNRESQLNLFVFDIIIKAININEINSIILLD